MTGQIREEPPDAVPETAKPAGEMVWAVGMTSRRLEIRHPIHAQSTKEWQNETKALCLAALPSAVLHRHSGRLSDGLVTR